MTAATRVHSLEAVDSQRHELNGRAARRSAT
jgi:hypothetical protein